MSKQHIKTLDEMTPPEIVKAIRGKDLRHKALLIKEGVSKGIWNHKEVAELLDVDAATITYWMKTYAK